MNSKSKKVEIEENIYGKYNHIFRDEINALFIEKNITLSNNSQHSTDNGIYGIKLSSILIPYFLASNGYAGFDISVIRYNSYHIIFWYKILTSKITTEKEKAIAGNEIKYFFYNWIGAFYSCKEKLLSFIGAEVENKSIVFKKTCLSADGQKAIKELFSKNNKLIEIFNIRNRVIHDAYDMEIDHEKNTIRIKHFGFTLTSEKDQRSSAYSYKIDDLNVANRYNDMEKLLEDYVCIIQKTTNINTDSFRRKFINKDGNFEMYI